MSYSTETFWTVNILMYGVFITAIILLWKKEQKEDELYLLLKLFSYGFLAMFRCNFNTIVLPLGFVIAFLLKQRAQSNRLLKTKAVFLGAIMFVLSFIPIYDVVENIYYPRNQITTYLHENISEQTGFNIFITAKNEIKKAVFDDKKFYESFLQFKQTKQILNKSYYTIEVIQDHPKDRFRRLYFEVSKDFTLARIDYDDRFYTFETSKSFQLYFKDLYE